VSPDTPDAINPAALFRAIDARDGAAFVSFLTEDAVFRFGSAPPVDGRDAIKASVEAFFGSIAGLAHHVTKVVQDGDSLICEGEVTYERHDGSKVTLPFANVLDCEADLVRHYKIYMDATPLFAS
jgi:ketosteroid isomerase-like protein